MDFRNAPKKRTTNFREDETKLLIQLWGSPVVQNKLYLTHRKAPVMRLIASNMQKHGFYRTSDEIKTRIRNLKCLYHRIKKSMTTGAGIGTVDPDWPHYKAMDEILSKKNALRQNLVYNHNLLSEVNSEIKEENEDIEINDDCDDSNSNGSDDEFEENSSLMPATITPLIIEEEEKIVTSPVKIAPKPPVSPPIVVSQSSPPTFPRIKFAQNLLATPTVSIAPKVLSNNLQTNQISQITNGTKVQEAPKANGALPFPLLILNGVQPGQKGTNGLVQKAIPINNVNSNANGFNSEVSNILKELLMVQKENLEIERERLAIERQKLEYERTVGNQLLNMVPAFNDIFQRFNKDTETEEPEDTKNFEGHPNFDKPGSGSKKRLAEDPLNPLKTSKCFKETVINGIKKYMQDEPVTNGDTVINGSLVANHTSC